MRAGEKEDTQMGHKCKSQYISGVRGKNFQKKLKNISFLGVYFWDPKKYLQNIWNFPS